MSGFDERRPPPQGVVDDCVHCGFCLPACPTYRLWGEEADSPRGRILLVDATLRGELDLEPSVSRHWDACLGCMACVPACPSGVRYDRLIEATRQQVERLVPRPWAERAWRRALFAVLPHRRRVGRAGRLLAIWRASGAQRTTRRLGLAGRLPTRLRAAEALAPALDRAELSSRVPLVVPSRGPARQRVALLTGCVQGGLFPGVNLATARVLAAHGCEVITPGDQGCCGALELHAGREQAARARARRLIAVLRATGADRIVVNSAGCGSAMKGWADLLGDDPRWAGPAEQAAARVVDVTELLDELGPAPGAILHPLPIRVAYHDACHLAHAQGIRRQPRAVLARVPGLEVLEVPDGDLCCGSAGIYNLVEPVTAAELGRRKGVAVGGIGADAVVAANPGCLLQISAATGQLGLVLPGFHPVELIDASLAGRDAGRLLARRRRLLESAGRPAPPG